MPYFDKEPGPQPNPYASMFSQLTASYSTLQSMALKQLLDKEYFKSGSVMSAQDKNSFFSAAAAMAAAASLSDQLKIDIPNSDQLFKYPFKTKSFVKKSSPAAAIPSLPTTATAASFIDTNNNIPNSEYKLNIPVTRIDATLINGDTHGTAKVRHQACN